MIIFLKNLLLSLKSYNSTSGKIKMLKQENNNLKDIIRDHSIIIENLAGLILDISLRQNIIEEEILKMYAGDTIDNIHILSMPGDDFIN